MNRIRVSDAKPELALAGIGVASAAGFAFLASKVLHPRTVLGDLRVRHHLPSYSRGARKAVLPFGYLGKEWAVLPGAGMLAAKLLRDGSQPGAAAVLTATLGAIAASHIFDVTLPQKTPPPGRKAPLDAHFPSGHALHSASLLATAAWVWSRERKADNRVVAAVAGGLAASLGVDRLIHDRHWTSDIMAGWLAALSIAAFTSAGYEVAMKRTTTKRKRARSPNSPARNGKR